MSDWTKEPWHIGQHYKSDVESPHGRICECGITRGIEAEKKASHIVACHNACLGMSDPEADVKALVDAVKLLGAFMDDLSSSNPGFLGKLVLQDYGQYNMAMIALDKALARLRSEP